MESKHTDSLLKTLLSSVPGWALGCIGTLFALAIVLKIVGIDFAKPINVMTDAYSNAIAAQQEGVRHFDQASKQMQYALSETRKSLDSMREDISVALDRQAGELNRLNAAVSSMRESMVGIESRVLTLERRTAAVSDFSKN